MAFILLWAEQDDDRQVARLTLEHAGHDVLCFGDDKALLRTLSELDPPPDLMVCDPGPAAAASGIWSKVPASWPVLVLSAGRMETGGRPVDVLPKPYLLRDLADRVQRLLRSRPTPV